MKLLSLAGFETRDNYRSSGGFRQGGHAYGESRMMDSGYHENGYFDGMKTMTLLLFRRTRKVLLLINYLIDVFLAMSICFSIICFFVCLLRLFQEKKFQ